MGLQRQITVVPAVAVGLAAVFAVFSVIGTADLISDFLHGGRRWQQGDWLINSLSGPVRRGTLGTAILLLSDGLGLNPLAIVVALQIVVVLTLALVLLRIAVLTVAHPAQIAVLLLPPFYPMMMVSRFDGMIYKDILALLAVALLSLAILRPGVKAQLSLAGIVLFLVACFAHEASVFFWPVAVWLTYCAYGGSQSGKTRMGLLTVGTGAAFAFAILFPQADPDAVCAQLVSRGLGTHLCAGPVGWLNATLADAVTFTFAETNIGYLVQFAGVWAASVLLVIYLWGLPLGRGLGIACLTLVPFLPLFPIALDFGRWFGFGFFSFLMIVMVTEPPLRFPDRTRSGFAVAAVICSLLMTYDSTSGVYWSGLVNRSLALVE